MVTGDTPENTTDIHTKSLTLNPPTITIGNAETPTSFEGELLRRGDLARSRRWPYERSPLPEITDLTSTKEGMINIVASNVKTSVQSTYRKKEIDFQTTSNEPNFEVASAKLDLQQDTNFSKINVRSATSAIPGW